MIQEIQPSIFYNTYKISSPQPQDLVFYFKGNQLLLKQGTGESTRLTTFSDLQNYDTFVEAGKFQYLFKIDGQNFFLLLQEKELQEKLGFVYVDVRVFWESEEQRLCFAAFTAYHLYVWYRDNQFCGRCGRPLIAGTKERVLYCADCGNLVYPKIAPAVIVGVINKNKILMTKYAGRTYKKYALIAGFTEIGETAEDTVHREVMEEVGLKVKNIRYYKSQPWGIDGNLLLGYFADLDGDDTIRLDAAELSVAKWINRADMQQMDDEVTLTREMMSMFYRNQC